jgi:hypothetical protein
MQDVWSWQHLFSHCLLVSIGTYHPNPLPQTREAYPALGSAEKCPGPSEVLRTAGRGAWGSVAGRGLGSELEPDGTASPYDSCLPILNPESCGGAKGNGRLLTTL